MWHLWFSHPLHVRVNTCTQLTHALTNPCTKQNVLSLTKPKGKIYKTKSDNIKKIPRQLYYNPTKQQLYGYQPPIMKIIKIRWTRHVGHCWRSRQELISDVLLWTHSHGRAKVERPAWTYIQQLCANTGCNPEDLLESMDNREGWRENVRDIRADGVTWWWWYIYIYIYIQVSFSK